MNRIPRSGHILQEKAVILLNLFLSERRIFLRLRIISISGMSALILTGGALFNHGKRAKYIQVLIRNSKLAKEQDFIFGFRAVIEAIRLGKEIDRVLLIKKPESQITNELFPLIREHLIPFQFVPVEKLNRITRKNHQGVIAFISHISYYPVDEIVIKCFDQGRDPFLLILDGITDVGNFGAIARSAECMGVDGIIIPGKGSVRITADAVKSSAGALLRIPVARVSSLRDTIEYLINSGIKIVAGTEKVNKHAASVQLTGPLAIITGSEDTGISSSLLKLAHEKISIPMQGEITSLNVSVATAILIYEAVRQRMSV